jgi:hypothetical protein
MKSRRVLHKRSNISILHTISLAQGRTTGRHAEIRGEETRAGSESGLKLLYEFQGFSDELQFDFLSSTY